MVSWLCWNGREMLEEESHVLLVRVRGVDVITPFLPTRFSRVSTRKTGQPRPSQHDPTKPRHIKYSPEEGPRHISQGLTKFD